MNWNKQDKNRVNSWGRDMTESGRVTTCDQMQINTNHWYKMKQSDIFMLNVCWIYEKVLIIKNLSKMAFHKLHNFSKLNSQNWVFFKGSLGTFSTGDKEVALYGLFFYCICKIEHKSNVVLFHNVNVNGEVRSNGREMLTGITGADRMSQISCNNLTLLTKKQTT